MATLQRKQGSLCLKLAYFGAAGSGKQTSLRLVHERLDAALRGAIFMSEQTADCLLGFEFSAPSVELAPGYQTRIRVHAATGHLMYGATSQLLLRNVDGIVFVVDSQVDRQQDNVKAWDSLRAGLRQSGVVLGDVPLVLQYNKRDLPNAAPLDYLDYLFNSGSTVLPRFETDAAGGRNVVATLSAATQLALQAFLDQMEAAQQVEDEEEPHLQAGLPERVSEAELATPS